MEKHILISGGAGYIGSVTVRFLVEKGIHPIVLDNLSTGHYQSIDKEAVFFEGDISDEKLVKEICRKYSIRSVLHFAASSLVGESMVDPGKYYINNVGKTAYFLKALQEAGIQYFVFSSTAATFGVPSEMPISEKTPQLPINPYGQSKLMIEQMLKEYERAYGIHYGILRYFNACGSYMEIGEDHDPETHLIPNMVGSFLNKEKNFKIFGNDYKTKDGTCVRDYIHVWDLASAHWLALQYIQKNERGEDFNLGNGLGYSILEVIGALEQKIGKKVEYQFDERRPGDPDILIASSEKAKKLLGWEPEFDIFQIVSSAFQWHEMHPKGYV